MWKKFVKDYLSFTKKDRVGLIVLLALIFFVVLLPYLWPYKKIPQPRKETIEEIKLAAARLNKPAENTAQPGENSDPNNFSAPTYYTKEKAPTFYFDPNTLDAAGWKRLGIRDKTVTTIQNYLSRGGKFKTPEDIGKIYGLFKDDYERLLPYVKIKPAPAAEHTGSQLSNAHTLADKPAYSEKKMRAPLVIDINNADTSAFIALPGIGSKLAARIVNFRSKLGGFYEVQQVAETYGLPDSTFDKIKPLLQCNHPTLQSININTADANALKQHPYIRWNLANLVVQYRLQHGNYKSVDDLLLLATVTPEQFNKIKPYLVVQ